MSMIYSNKTWSGITFREELEELKSQLDLKIVHVLREPPENWQGETGYVDRQLLEKYLPPHRGSRHYFICAVPAMMETVEAALYDLEISQLDSQIAEMCSWKTADYKVIQANMSKNSDLLRFSA